MDETNIAVGDEVTSSPVGPGTVTGFDASGYPQIDGKAVGYFTRSDGAEYGPFGTLVAQRQGEPVKALGYDDYFVQGGAPAPVTGSTEAPASAPQAPATAPAPVAEPSTTAPPADAPAAPVPTTQNSGLAPVDLMSVGS